MLVDAVEVRRSPRARRWRLEVPWGEPVRLTVPRRMSRAEIERVLARKRAWIEEQGRRQVPRLGLEGMVVGQSEARIGVRELASILAEAQVGPLREACPHPRSRTHAPADDLVDAKRAGTTVRNPEALSKRNGLGRSSHWVALTDGLSRSSAAFLELWRLLGTRLLLLSLLFFPHLAPARECSDRTG